MPHQVITYENDIIECCGQKFCKECTECNNEDSICKKKCSKKHFEKIKKLCDGNYLEGLKIERKAGKEIIKCSKYTAYFQIDDVEFCILPKIDQDIEDKDTGVKIFYNLLNSTDKFKDFKVANDSSTTLGHSMLFRELIISKFCDMMDEFFKKGVKKFYNVEEDNLPYLKGKIKFSEHIKRNIVSKEKFYVEYDEFTENIPENRILKTACLHILKKSKKEENIKRLRRYIKEFGEINESKNIIKDFARIQENRLYKQYDEPLNYAEVFLNDKYFWPRKGKKKFPAILFSLHDLFENYVEKLLKNYRDLEKKFYYKKQLRVIEEKFNYLIPEEKMFATKMDFVLRDAQRYKDCTKYVIFDAKYKIINFADNMKKAQDEENISNEEQNQYNEYYNQTNITQADLYQIYAYAKLIQNNCGIKKEDVKVALLYPENKNFEDIKPFKFFDGTVIYFVPIILDSNEENIYKDNEEYLLTAIKELFEK